MMFKKDDKETMQGDTYEVSKTRWSLENKINGH